MAWVTPRTWVAADVPTAAQFNQDMRDNLTYLLGARGTDLEPTWWFARDNSLGPIAHAAVAVANFDTITHAVGTHALSGTAIVVAELGVYYVQASCQWDTNGVVAIRVLKDGANFEFGNCAWYGNNVNWHVNPACSRLLRITAAAGGTLSVTAASRVNSAASNAFFLNFHGARMAAA